MLLARVFVSLQLVASMSLLLLLLMLPISTEAAQRRLEQDQGVECKPQQQQFYFEPTNSCKSCSHLERMFDNYGKWLNDQLTTTAGHQVQEGSTSSSSNSNSSIGSSSSSSSSSGSRTISSVKEVSIFKSSPSSGNGIGHYPGAAEVVDVALSRLINLERDQSADGSQDQLSANYLEEQGDGDANSRRTQTSSSSSSQYQTGELYESSASLDLIRDKTKQVTKFVSQFVRFHHAIGERLLSTMEECKQNQNASACQMWSNLCVMTMYSHSDTLDLSGQGDHYRPSHEQQLHYAASGSTTSSSGSGRSAASTTQADQLRKGLNNLNSGWQHCKQFNMNSICNSLRDWHSRERKSIGVENALQSIYATNDEPNFGATSMATGPGGLPAAANLVLRPNQPIQLLAYRYSFEGNLIGVDQFGPAEMESFCLRSMGSLRLARSSKAAPSRQSGGYFRFGRSMKLEACSSSELEALQLLQDELQLNATQFVDLYIAYPSGGSMLIKPVPILMKNLLYNGNLINQKYSKDSSRWQLVHRFFYRSLIINQSRNQPGDISRSKQTGSERSQLVDEDDEDSNGDYGDHQLHLLYAKSVVLDLKFRKGLDKGALLSSILLTIDYGIVSRPLASYPSVLYGSTKLLNKSADETRLETSIFVEQSLIDMQAYKKDLDLAITILSILSSIWSLIKCYNIQKCCGNVKLDLESLLRFVIIGCDTVALLLLAVLFIFTSYLFVALKLQHSSVQVLAPNEQLESSLMINLQLAFAFKLIGLAHRLYLHLNADIFFIDWERPKMLTSSQILNLSYHQHEHQNDAPDKNEKPLLQPGYNRQQQQQHQQQQVSFWRPYTVINRWFQLQTLRRLDLTLQLIVFVLVCHLGQVTQLASADLSLNLSDSTEDQTRQLSSRQSFLFRALVLAYLYAGLAIVQVLYRKYFHEPWIRDPVREFVDLCSVANVSLFCWLYPRFGYYVHGRNANGSGDRGIGEMNALLEREERDLCSKRGLAPNSDQQTFILILPKVINDHYRNLLSKESQNFATRLSSVVASKQHQMIDQLTGVSSGNNGNNSLLQSALNLQSSSSLSGVRSSSSATATSGGRSRIDCVTAKHRSIQQFLTNFLEHVYKDIDYAIRDGRRFENLLLLDFDFNEDDDEALVSSSSAAASPEAADTISGGLSRSPNPTTQPILATQQQAPQRHQAATFCKDGQNSFASLLWLGLEFDLILVELVSFLVLDFWLGEPAPIITASLLWFAHRAFKSIYISCSRYNLISKALVDEKFLFHT